MNSSPAALLSDALPGLCSTANENADEAGVFLSYLRVDFEMLY
jgi:hypothetical protein